MFCRSKPSFSQSANTSSRIPYCFCASAFSSSLSSEYLTPLFIVSSKFISGIGVSVASGITVVSGSSVSSASGNTPSSFSVDGVSTASCSDADSSFLSSISSFLSSVSFLISSSFSSAFSSIKLFSVSSFITCSSDTDDSLVFSTSANTIGIDVNIIDIIINSDIILFSLLICFLPPLYFLRFWRS